MSNYSSMNASSIRYSTYPQTSDNSHHGRDRRSKSKERRSKSRSRKRSRSRSHRHKGNDRLGYSPDREKGKKKNKFDVKEIPKDTVMVEVK